MSCEHFGEALSWESALWPPGFCPYWSFCLECPLSPVKSELLVILQDPVQNPLLQKSCPESLLQEDSYSLRESSSGFALYKVPREAKPME